MDAEQPQLKSVRLSGWARIGIAISSIWLVGVGTWAMYEHAQFDDTCYDYRSSLRCNDTAYFVEWTFIESGFAAAAEADEAYRQKKPVPSEVKSRMAAGSEYARQFKQEFFLKVWLFPVVAGWIFCMLLVWTVRWIRNGFKS